MYSIILLFNLKIITKRVKKKKKKKGKRRKWRKKKRKKWKKRAEVDLIPICVCVSIHAILKYAIFN